MRKIVDAADKTAISLSILCTLQCLLLPVVMVLVPAISGWLVFDDEIFHLWLLFFVLPISTFAVIFGFYHHRNARVATISCVGMALLIIAAAFGHDIFGEVGEIGLTVAGSLFIAYGHLKNFSLRRRPACVITESA
ncbi:MerC domain-containing protein [Alteromonas sp. ASW11-36]|uniref:MerC domain-containing protein n=1 Tax=Alteromonas arenosi TaxID=3055817 RepID=A0ABT7SWQ6_9ALTE|nr:MerC domain-containing protein [Alteromonas sp. ASW11-36]MDM7860434.1 MerC domain-containing protein [Alteromonas sp. ASW11-36]